MGDLLAPWHLIVLLIIAILNAVYIPPFWRIFKKLGVTPTLSLLMALPIVNLVTLYVVGFSDRPAASPDASPADTSIATTRIRKDVRGVLSTASSEGMRRLSLGVAAIVTLVSLVIIATNVTPGSDSVLVLLPILVASITLGGIAWGVVRMVDWTIAGFRTNQTALAGDLKMSKYDPLYRHLSEQPASRVTMSFSEIESVLGSALPASARKYTAWWANANPETGQHPYSQAWMLVGMRATVNLAAERVVFEKSI